VLGTTTSALGLACWGRGLRGSVWSNFAYNKQKTWILVEPDYFIAHGCFALLIMGKDNIKAVHNLLHDDELDLYPVDVMYSRHIQIEGGAYILNPPMATHRQQQVSQRCDAARALHRRTRATQVLL
jgi:hypothetical protein